MPAELTRILRESYLDMVATAEYRDEAAKRGFDVGAPNTGEAITDYVTNTLSKFPGRDDCGVSHLRGAALADQLSSIASTRFG